MKRFFTFAALLVYLLFLVSCGGGGGGGNSTGTTPDDPDPIPLPVPSDNPPLQNVLILYDTAGSYGDQGKINALLLENLLGHFDINITSKPAEEYTANEMDEHNISTVFYLGTTFDVLDYYTADSNESTSYMNFYQDAATQNKTVVWINYNLELLEEAWETNSWENSTFEEKTGFTSFGSYFDYTRVSYKDTELFKGVIPFLTPGSDPTNCELEPEIENAYACALELNTILITDNNKTSILAESNSTLDSSIENEPYITHGGNFWFVGDVPFTYMSEEDRYLAFADILHDMLGIAHNESHKAIVRLEDVNAKTSLSDLMAIADYMQSQSIPFNVATIPQYEDPFVY